MTEFIPEELFKAFSKIRPNSSNYCTVCLRPGEQRRLVQPIAFKKFLTTVYVDYQLDPNSLICFICENHAQAACRFYRATMFAITVKFLFKDYMASRKIGTGLAKERRRFNKVLEERKANYGKTIQHWDSDLKNIRQRSELQQTDVMVIDSLGIQLGSTSDSESEVFIIPNDLTEVTDSMLQNKHRTTGTNSVIVIDDEEMTTNIGQPNANDPQPTGLFTRDQLNTDLLTVTPSVNTMPMMKLVPMLPSINTVPILPSMNAIPVTPSLNPVPVTPSLNPVPVTPSLNPVPVTPSLNPVPVTPSLNPVPVTPSLNPVPVTPSLNPVPVTPTLNPVPVTPSVNSVAVANIVTSNVTTPRVVSNELVLEQSTTGFILHPVVVNKNGQISVPSLQGNAITNCLLRMAKNNNIVNANETKNMCLRGEGPGGAGRGRLLNHDCITELAEEIRADADISFNNQFNDDHTKRKQAQLEPIIVDVKSGETWGIGEVKKMKVDEVPCKLPVQKNDRIDWEDKIPIDVISFMDATDPNAGDLYSTCNTQKLQYQITQVRSLSEAEPHAPAHSTRDGVIDLC